MGLVGDDCPSDTDDEIAGVEYAAQKTTQITQKTTRDRILDYLRAEP